MSTTKPYWPNVSGHPEGSYAGSYKDGFGMKCDVYVVGKTAFIRCHDGRTEADVPVKTALEDPDQWPDVSALIRAHRPAPAAPQETREEVLERAARRIYDQDNTTPWTSTGEDRRDRFRALVREVLEKASHPLFPATPAPRIPTPDELADAVEALKAVATAMRDYHEHGKHVNALAKMAGDALAKLTFDADAVRAMGKAVG